MSKVLPTLIVLLFVLIADASAKYGSLDPFYDATTRLFDQFVEDGRVDYDALKRSEALGPIVSQIASAELEDLSPLEREAFLINAYNVLVIDQVLLNYPLASVLDVKSFFDAKRVTVAGRRLSLNALEKEYLLKEYKDPRLHFVLVCGALDCPPIIGKPYLPETLEAQLAQQTTLAVNDQQFLRTTAEGVELSQIFNWYATDFGGSKKEVIRFINAYKQTPVSANTKVSYYDYNWALNQRTNRTGSISKDVQDATQSSASGGANASRYVVSSTIAKGTYEFKLFNNLYSQDAAGERATFFSSTLSALYGLNERINVGFDARYRRVRYDQDGETNNLAVLASPGPNSQFRQGLTGFGPKIRIAPFLAAPNFSIQSTYLFSTQEDASGQANGQRFIDFDGDTWITQLFNDFTIGNSFSIFTELDFILEDIGSADKGRINRASTPVTGIFSYFPNSKTTVYGLGSYSPFWQSDFDYFTQVGAGVKYQFTPKFELELLATSFSNSFIKGADGSASTVNLGLRFNL
ncbi:MAG: DUF547 domain-containing protein [Saprospiraceae bacterium]